MGKKKEIILIIKTKEQTEYALERFNDEQINKMLNPDVEQSDVKPSFVKPVSGLSAGVKKKIKKYNKHI